MNSLDAKSLERAAAVGAGAGRYARRYNLFAEGASLGQVVAFVRDRLYGSDVATFRTTRYDRVREDAIMYAIAAMQKELPTLRIEPEHLSVDQIECARRLSHEEQRAWQLQLDRDEVEDDLRRREQRLNAYVAMRSERLRMREIDPHIAEAMRKLASRKPEEINVEDLAPAIQAAVESGVTAPELYERYKDMGVKLKSLDGFKHDVANIMTRRQPRLLL